MFRDEDEFMDYMMAWVTMAADSSDNGLHILTEDGLSLTTEDGTHLNVES